MKKSSYPLIIISVLIIVASVALLFGGLFSDRFGLNKGTIPVAATIFPLYDIVRTVGGDAVQVTLLLPEGESLAAVDHLYDGANLEDLSTIFAIGHGLDTAGIPEASKSKIFTVDEDVNLMLEQGSTASPYYWLSLRETASIARNVARKLAEIDPRNARNYEERLNVFLKNAAYEDQLIRDLLPQAGTDKIAVYGYDWSYFARDYDLDIVWFHPPVLEALPDDARSSLDDAVSTYGLVSIFSDMGTDPKPLLPFTLKGSTSILTLDTLGGLEDRESYLQLMAYNARQLFDGLGGKAQ